ncbi:MAG: hypothetical protein NXI15_07375 [Gammaproteobacteria bacterium]|nr:hypothetical protein [Gammaproteobacteria bacterium]
MDVILITLGVLGLGAIVFSAWVFMVAARNYVSDEPSYQRRASGRRGPHHYIDRAASDRRSGQPATFPLMVNGILIERDRRVLPDRRAA